jgi:hypothetical protein
MVRVSGMVRVSAMVRGRFESNYRPRGPSRSTPSRPRLRMRGGRTSLRAERRCPRRREASWSGITRMAAHSRVQLRGREAAQRPRVRSLKVEVCSKAFALRARATPKPAQTNRSTATPRRASYPVASGSRDGVQLPLRPPRAQPPVHDRNQLALCGLPRHQGVQAP